MELKIFSIYDRAIKAFNKPFYFLTQAEATRAFTSLANDNESEISKHPHDFELHYLGKWDNATGIAEQGVLENLGNALAYQNQETTANVVPMEKKA